MNTKDVLIAARKKIERPECWTHEEFARTRTGEPLLMGSDSGAVCWCAIGSIQSVVGGLVEVVCPDVGAALARAVPEGYHSVPHFNDAETTTHADVLALFDRAIAACKEE